MKIENFETKFSAEDIVYFMKGNELCKGIVKGVMVKIEERANLGTINEYYKVFRVREDGSFYCAYGGYFRDWDLAHTKEELFKMLESKQI